MFTGNFNGEYRRKPIVSIRGASKAESKSELIQRAQKERQSREVNRLKEVSAVKIQALFRGFSVRKRERKRVRDEFVALQNQKKEIWTLDELERLLNRLVYFYTDPSLDGQYLNWICGICVRQRQDLIRILMENPSSKWHHKMSRLLDTALKYIGAGNPSDNLTAPLRLIEIFTTTSSFNGNETIVLRFLSYQVSKGKYFESVRKLADSRIPPLMSETIKPPNPISGLILDMIQRPLELVAPDNRVFSSLVLRRLSESFFCKPFTEQILLFILPSLKRFPYKEWIVALSDYPPEPSPYLLYAFLKLENISLGNLNTIELIQYLTVLSNLTSSILAYCKKEEQVYEEENDDDEDDVDITSKKNGLQEMDGILRTSDDIIKSIFVMLNDPKWVSEIVAGVAERCPDEPLVLRSLCRLAHHLLISDKMALHKYRLLYTLAFKTNILHKLWDNILECKQPSLFGSPVPLLTIISRGLRMSPKERDEIVPLLAVFSALFGYLLVTIHDTEFYGDEDPSSSNPISNRFWMPFTLAELVPMSLSLRDVTLGLVELAFPESRPTVREDYQLAVRSVRTEAPETSATDTYIWSHVFKKTVELVRQLYTRDTRRQFCPDGHWICDRITLPLDRPNDISLRRSRLRQYRPFRGLRAFTREELEEEGPPLSTKEVRLATVLREMPYAISFNQRVLVFSNLVNRDKGEHQGDRVNFLQGPSIVVLIRRNFIYEDAFEKLSPENEPNMKLKMRVQLMNAAGLDEAGIDGGGLFREFLNELHKTAFDPNRGFFRLTKDQHLYPNPSVHQIIENFIPHYYFIGRMLGKALYENMLVELPLASFFLSKLLGQHSANVDIDHLYSLDPELYKNLLYLKTYDGDVQDLGLDFTIVNEEVGKTTVEELKSNGSSLAVTNENRIEYIHLVADYKLNRQIRAQCSAFRQGLADVINLDWLRMFSYRELQTLISGAEHEIDVQDLRQHTNYSGGYSVDHPTIERFWKVVESMSEEQKRYLLRFVTSCSRPPLLGFKELDPPFCVQNAGNEAERLPTASTCMNLLKLPDFRDENILRSKLLYAIESGAGFELS